MLRQQKISLTASVIFLNNEEWGMKIFNPSVLRTPPLREGRNIGVAILVCIFLKTREGIVSKIKSQPE